MRATYRNHGCRLMECSYQGQRVLFLENELLRVGVLVDKGADIFQFLYKPTDTEFMLHTPHGIQPPAVQSTASASWGSFLDYYEGGWQEILPNGGAACTYKGIEFGLHGEISTIPWQYRIDADTPVEVQVTLQVEPFRTPLQLERRMILRTGEPVLIIEEALTNHGREPMDFMWGHHPALGAPFLSPSCRCDLPAGNLILEVFGDGDAGSRLSSRKQHRWPLATEDSGVSVDFSRPDPPGVDQEDLGYVIDLPEGWYAITNQQLAVGFAMTWPLEVFPCLWVWRLFNRSAGYPWYGRVYTMALEPWCGYPSAGLATAIENGSAGKIEPGETIHATLRAITYHGIRQVSQVSPTGEVEE